MWRVYRKKECPCLWRPISILWIFLYNKNVGTEFNNLFTHDKSRWFFFTSGMERVIISSIIKIAAELVWTMTMTWPSCRQYTYQSKPCFVCCSPQKAPQQNIKGPLVVASIIPERVTETCDVITSHHGCGRKLNFFMIEWIIRAPNPAILITSR
jgi:hypothetical protein